VKIELNIRLDTHTGNNSIAECTRRAIDALDLLHIAFGEVHGRRLDLQVENEYIDRLDLHQLLLVRIDNCKLPKDLARKTIFDLAELLEQDCIAVYYPSQQRGELLGTRLGEYTDGFDINKFIDFQESVSTN